MGFNEFIGKLFGNKQTRDIKEIQPWVEKIKAAYPKYEKLSNDDLRAATQQIRQKVRDLSYLRKNVLKNLRPRLSRLNLKKENRCSIR